MTKPDKGAGEGLTPKPPHGSAFQWAPEIEAELFKLIADGESLRAICEDDWLPSRETVRKRLMDDDAFAGQYARAREAQADTLVDQIIEIADNTRGDWIEGEGEGGPRLNAEHIQRSRVRIDARKWMAGKLRPKVYGEKLAIGGASDLPPVAVTAVTRRIVDPADGNDN